MLIYQSQRNRRVVIGVAALLLVLLLLSIGSYVWYEHAMSRASDEAASTDYTKSIALESESINKSVQETEPIKETIQYEADDRLMEHNFEPGTVPIAAIVGTLVDIKLVKDNAEDQIVISKAAVVQRNETILAFYLNAIEQEYLKDAAAEGNLILTVYANNSQPPSIVTYVPSYALMKR